MSFIKTKNNSMEIYMKEMIANDNAPNVIFCITPILSVDVMENGCKPIVERGFNVFAFDFRGTCKSKGTASVFTTNNILDDFDCVTSYIKGKYSGNIYLFANAGIGGILGQYYASGTTELKGFAQFAAGIHRETAELGIPSAARILLPILRILCKIMPGARVNMNPPAYKGFHEEQDNGVYKHMLQIDPGCFKVSIHFLRVLFEIMMAPDSRLKKTVTIPTLVFKTTHDRYYPEEYFDRYYQMLTCKKQLCVMEDVHNSYFLYPEKFAEAVCKWFQKVEGSL